MKRTIKTKIADRRLMAKLWASKRGVTLVANEGGVNFHGVWWNDAHGSTHLTGWQDAIRECLRIVEEDKS